MIDTLTFLHQEWLFFAVVCGILLWLVFLWKEWSQSNRLRFILKGFVAWLAIGMLVLIVLKPMYESDSVKGVGVLLTEGYETRVLDSLKNTIKGVKVLPYNESVALRKPLDSIGTLYVLGDGIAPYDFWKVKNQQVEYLGGKSPSGIVKLQYDTHLVVGDSLLLSGLYQSPSLNHKLILEDPGGNKVDSLELGAQDEQRFTITAPLSVVGKYVYHLTEKDSLGEVVSTGPIPIIVKERDVLDILIVNNFPTFESKYLKNYLARKGHRLLVRSKLTKDRFKFENFNRDRTTIAGFTQENLAEFDLLVLDSPSLFGLSWSSKVALERAIEDDGLGLFIQSDNQVFQATQRELIFRFKRKNTNTVSIDRLPKTTIQTYDYIFENETLLQPIFQSSEHIIAAYQLKGLGRLGTSVLKDTYQLILDGNQETYSYIWSTLITELAKRKPLDAAWEGKTILKYQDEPFSFRLRTAVAQPTVLGNGTYRVPLKGNTVSEDVWTGVVYPRNTGWESLSMAQDSSAVWDYYIMDATEWQAVKRFTVAEKNSRFFYNPTERSELASSKQQVPRVWFFIVFVLSMGFLWMEPRFF